ncbi:uncharacterized protein K460DRAFT_350870 [Cucurbitaria berberidis CBS 394.84]|uniref:Uncharacterized protein n=1 Tax=Cucurbitaria berberidis CBS 394.84 TaxID=1168544 RepID=A0A9P4GT48_9PLEO|nr:uncharacterized protein K460DRAFT_350870 [Cucurbitaria berberidis CBS 394.84]KAF1850870.1 hypothetical protein K460DRAFT_350870 [Cucurbitaria berberidis CBS 394.84]
MAPKKAAATNGEAGEAGGKFTWEGPNDNKLLLLTQGRYVKPDEYDQLSKAFSGTTIGSIRNRISALRVKQRDLYETLGWDVPEGGAGHSAKKTKGGKRSIDDDSGEPQTPTKKSRATKAKKTPKKGGSDGESGGEKGLVVKEEEVEPDEV